MKRWSLPYNPETLGRLALPVNVFLVILLAHSLARLTWMLVPGAGSPIRSQIATQNELTPASTVANETMDYAAIADWHLFGEINQAATLPTPTRSMPETQLNLRLAGIFFAEDMTKGRVLIAKPGAQESSYRVGDQLPGGARLEQILRDQVILSRNGVLETLRLPRETSLNNRASSNSAARPISLPVAAAQSQSATVDASVLVERLRQEVATRPQALEDLAFASPYQQDGQFIGFRLRPGRDRKLMGQLGLQAGDVVTEVNGVRLVDPAQGLTVMQELLNADQIAIQVLRNGTEIPLTFALSSATN